MENSKTIYIIDFGVSNVASVANMVKKVGGNPSIIKKSNNLNQKLINKIILPGVGSFDSAMVALEKEGWLDPLNEFISNSQNKILGICLGMQIMFNKSEEGQKEGLKWIDGDIEKFKFEDKKLKVPHMGWNTVSIKNNSSLFKESIKTQRYYFVHSYYAQCFDSTNIAAKTFYGFDFVSAIQKQNIYGFQFHPEKSHRYGMHLLKNFVEL